MQSPWKTHGWVVNFAQSYLNLLRDSYPTSELPISYFLTKVTTYFVVAKQTGSFCSSEWPVLPWLWQGEHASKPQEQTPAQPLPASWVQWRLCLEIVDFLVITLSNGWNATHFPVEVGSRGFVAYSLMRCLTQLGFPSYWAKKVRNEASKVSLRCSYLIYLRRNIRVWQERLGD